MPFSHILPAAIVLATMILGGVILLVDPNRVWAKLEKQAGVDARPFSPSESPDVLLALRCAGGVLLFIAQNLLWQALNS